MYYYLTVPRTSVSSRKTGMIMERLRNFNELKHGEHLKQFLALIVLSGSTEDPAQSRGAGWARQKAAGKRLRGRQGPSGRPRRSAAPFREQPSPAPQLSGRGRRRQSTKPESSIPAPPPSQPGQVTLRPLLPVPPPPSIGRRVSLLAGACGRHWPAGLPVAAPRPAPPRVRAAPRSVRSRWRRAPGERHGWTCRPAPWGRPRWRQRPEAASVHGPAAARRRGGARGGARALRPRRAGGARRERGGLSGPAAASAKCGGGRAESRPPGARWAGVARAAAA